MRMRAEMVKSTELLTFSYIKLIFDMSLNPVSDCLLNLDLYFMYSMLLFAEKKYLFSRTGSLALRNCE